MTDRIPDRVRSFLETHRFATVATIDPDGSPFQVRTWYLFDGDRLVVNSADGRRWPANLRRDPRVSVTVEDGYDWVRLSGRVESDDRPERAQADIARMARAYEEPAVAEDSIRRFQRERRVSFVLRPDGVRGEFEEG